VLNLNKREFKLLNNEVIKLNDVLNIKTYNYKVHAENLITIINDSERFVYVNKIRVRQNLYLYDIF